VKRELAVLPAARRDMLEQAEFYDSEAGEQWGDRFVQACESALARLIEFPAMGAKFRQRSPVLRGCRFLVVPGFEMSLIFYRLSKSRIEVIRVVHGARDLGTLD
jgi:toxin ParE1/3/4